MGESSNEPSLLDRINSWAKAHASSRHPKDSQRSILPLSNVSSNGSDPSPRPPATSTAQSSTTKSRPSYVNNASSSSGSTRNNAVDVTSSKPPPPAPPPDNTQHDGATSAAVGQEKPPMSTRLKNSSIRFCHHFKDALCYSWVNVLLVFVPIGIATKPAGMNPELIFSMNAVAIIPLAGLLSHATESVAVRLGDTLGALLNVSFGNAVELILFIILLVKNEIRVVQASLLGSILANLLLILGMAFLFGGLRYQEQIYNNTVTQMSACLLSLAVMSLLLPTAFHASFSNYTRADEQTLRVSRGTSVILLLVYGLYLLFQLKSHAYMYESTPQHIIDEESHPGVLADMLNSSSSSSSSDDSSSSDTDSSSGSHTTAKRIKRAFRHRKRRKSNASSKDTPSIPSVMSSPDVENHDAFFQTQGRAPDSQSRRGSALGAIASGDEADLDEFSRPGAEPLVRDFEAGSSGSPPHEKKRKKKRSKKHSRHQQDDTEEFNEKEPARASALSPVQETNTPTVGFSDVVTEGVAASPAPARRPFNLRQLSARPGLPRPALPSLLSNNVFLEEPEMSRTCAIVMLLISTGLVAVCADFMSDAIEPMVESTGISQAFIGLIILPIVGNAAEHVTAVTVAAKNKMDLAIGVAVGSSIQIALFITPVIVILGWIMGKAMSLYFNIFETVSLFVTAFVVNFLVLDGRSNYMEGSLLIAAYVVIAVASFFYPDGCDASQIGGQDGTC
ncbi:calcium/proton exchanger [Saccharata proteae CBS 121410]|uniref:Calcium/proton exchanger n=1 Tax=Saccharata proteae CBS 121410 TaxID=1314787 RepID=A0A9P4LZ64_9PEZI|nr:calcium/proton exchanger [Saccharata proteae CBS 121410]